MEGSEDFLSDLGAFIGNAALEARAERDQAKGTVNAEFSSGRLAGYYEVVSLIKQQAEAFGLEPSAVGLGDVEPDRDLL